MWLPPDNLSRIPLRISDLTTVCREIRWGAWALIALYISILSGIVVGLQYDYQTPYYSTSSIEILVPYGNFFRSLHFYSSQFFFFLSCFHLILVYPKTASYTWREWLKLTGTLPVILLLLFTGYVLRGDSTGSSAGMIAENIATTIPVLGPSINMAFFSLTETGLRKVYLHHVVGLDVVLLLLLWKHLRVYRVQTIVYAPTAAAILVFCMIIPAPLEPEQLGVNYISGPWFFLGLQELLRYFHPLIAGVAIPLLLLLSLFLTYPGQRRSDIFIPLFWCGIAMYTVFTIIAWLR
jgi:hypothetical protein